MSRSRHVLTQFVLRSFLAPALRSQPALNPNPKPCLPVLRATQGQGLGFNSPPRNAQDWFDMDDFVPDGMGCGF